MSNPTEARGAALDMLRQRPRPTFHTVASATGLSYATVYRLWQAHKATLHAADQQTSDELADGSHDPLLDNRRARILNWLLDPNRPSMPKIAQLCDCSTITVKRVWRDFQQQGAAFALEDGRVRSGRRSQFVKAWERILALKQEYKSWGGQELWAYLVGRENWPPDDLPQPSRIDGFLSEHKMVHKAATPKNDRHKNLRTRATFPLQICQMDDKYPLTNAHGDALLVVDCIDVYTGAVYCEPFKKGLYNPVLAPLDEATWTAVFLRFCAHCGIPKELQIDNNAGQIPHSGHLPQIARHCINLGVVLTYEPYSRPWWNGGIERWHRELDKWWREVGPTSYSLTHSANLVREYALFKTVTYRRKQLGNASAATALKFEPWPVDDEIATLQPAERIAEGQIAQPGIVRAHRTVEQNGYVQLWANEFVIVQDLLVGGYVTIDFTVMPNGEPGFGEIRDGKGEIVVTFKHNMDAKRHPSDPLIFDKQFHTYSGMEQLQVHNYNQAVRNEEAHKYHKGRRAKQAYKQTGSFNPYPDKVPKRKKLAE